MSKHTELPWASGFFPTVFGPTTERCDGACAGGQAWKSYHVCRGSETIAICPNQDSGARRQIEGSGQENAEFIVRACNSHVALLAALEVISMCEDNHYHDDPESDYDQGRRSMARYVAGIADAAIEKIKKANGEDANEATIPKARFEKMIAERNARIKEIQR